jgi:hypothetical protein
MAKTGSNIHDPRPSTDAESLLESYYSNLLKWAFLLTRGNDALDLAFLPDSEIAPVI